MECQRRGANEELEEGAGHCRMQTSGQDTTIEVFFKNEILLSFFGGGIVCVPQHTRGGQRTTVNYFIQSCGSLESNLGHQDW